MCQRAWPFSVHLCHTVSGRPGEVPGRRILLSRGNLAIETGKAQTAQKMQSGGHEWPFSELFPASVHRCTGPDRISHIFFCRRLRQLSTVNPHRSYWPALPHYPILNLPFPISLRLRIHVRIDNDPFMSTHISVYEGLTIRKRIPGCALGAWPQDIDRGNQSFRTWKRWVCFVLFVSRYPSSSPLMARGTCGGFVSSNTHGRRVSS